MIPSSEEIAAIDHGDIITVRWLKSKGYCENYEPSLYSENEYISLKFLALARDANNNIAAAIISSLDGLDFDLPKLYAFDSVYYGNKEFELIKLNLEKISSPVDFNKEKTRYIYDDWIFEIEKFQRKNHDPGGMHCCECSEFYRYAVSNLSNGKLACWSCRNSYRWKYNDIFIGK